MFQVAMLSKWHVHAAGYARELMEMPDVQITCLWDEEPERGAQWAQELGVDFEPDLDKLLARKDVQGVAVCTPTNMHPDVMIRAAKAGKHIFTEKVLATTVADAERIRDAIVEAGVKFTISFPHRCWPRTQYIKNVVDQGLLGEVTLMRFRNTHAGASRNWLPDYWYDPETTGGGAMMDLGAHPMYLSSWMMGKPKSIQSTFNYRTGRAVEDDSISIITFENGVVSMVETSLVNPHASNSMEIYGTDGALLINDGVIRLRSDKLPEDMQGWLTPANLPEKLPEPIRQWVESVVEGKPIVFDTTAAIELTRLMEGAYKAHKEKRTIEF